MKLDVRNCFLVSLQFFKDKTRYSTLTRMSYCQCRLKLVFASIFKEFGFKHVALLLDRSDLFSLTVGKNLEYGLKEDGVLKFVKELDGNELLSDGKVNKSENDRQMRDLKTYLKDASMYARVVILSVRGQLVRKFMLAAHQLGMTKGDWVFFDVEIFQVSCQLNFPDDSPLMFFLCLLRAAIGEITTGKRVKQMQLLLSSLIVSF